MKKPLCLLACMAINLALLAGCSTYVKSTSAVVTEKPLTKTVSSESTIITEWKPTPYATVNNLDGVAMTVNKETMSPTKLTVSFKNSSNLQCIYGDYFWLEKKITGKWQQVPDIINGNYGFNAIGYDLASGSVSDKVVDWNWLYGSLDAGEYRIVKDIMDFRGPEDYDTYYLGAEFAIY